MIVIIIIIIIIILIIIILNVNNNSNTKSSDYSKPIKDNSIGVEKKYIHLVDKYGISAKREDNGNVTLSVGFDESETKKPYFLIFDIETTGLAPRTDATKKNFNRFPRVVQFAWMILDREYKMVTFKNKIIKQYEPIPFESTIIHNITDEIAAEKGEEMMYVLDEFLEDLNGIMFIVAHNVDFDYNVIRSEMFRFNKDESLFNKSWRFCTMKHSIYYCKIPKYGITSQEAAAMLDYKYPKLQELIKKCFFEKEEYFNMQNMHDAKTDVFWTAKCFQKLIEDSGIDVIGGENLPVYLFLNNRTPHT